ncbi:hypothetical protein B484DRAFT_401615 [Ochromonadaceae sp. CCMP2298]|nr:hypothetical protein B484DRAFT_401615 [Ochromonadaceae sp. CCMP2298]
MGFLTNIFSIASFLSGTCFGVLLCLALAFQLIKGKPSKKSRDEVRESIEESPVGAACGLSTEDLERLKRVVDFLDNFNSPLKSVGTFLQDMYKQKEVKAAAINLSAKELVGLSVVLKTERNLQDSLAGLKEHGKVMKGVTAFLAELGKVFGSFSKDLTRLANVSKSNMYKGLHNLNIDTKEELIINNWWQALHVALDYMASDQEYLASQISHDLLSYSVQIHEELAVLEKRLSAECQKQVAGMREQLSSYEGKRKARDTYRERVRNAPAATMTTQTPQEIAQRRSLKMRINEESLSQQSKRLHSTQVEFLTMMPRLEADVQLAQLRSIVETHAQLNKLAEFFDGQHQSSLPVTKRLKLQLTNAAASLMQMVREESRSFEPSVLAMTATNPHPPTSDPIPSSSSRANANSPSNTPASPTPIGIPALAKLSRAERRCAESVAAYEASLRARMHDRGVQGYELSLQHVLEGLLQQSQHNLDPASDLPSRSPTSPSNTDKGLEGEASGRLNMGKESTANLAASNPAVLPALPFGFHRAVAAETCVWFNSFSGRVYRDIADSEYFYNWFCAKLTQLLNKGQRPDYVDEFRVENVQFGTLPPLLLNVQWSPNTAKGPFDKTEKKQGADGSLGAMAAAAVAAAVASGTEKRSASPGAGADEGPGEQTPYSGESSSSEGSGSEREAGRRQEEEGARSTTPFGRAQSSGSASGSGRFVQREEQSPEQRGAERGAEKGRRRRKRDKIDADEDHDYYAACTADMAYRSGCSVTISTKLWINWPRERYASVPVTLHLELAEISGSIRFGVTRSHSFFSFLGDPLMRINVRNEVGKGLIKFKDMPQLSDFIVKKLKSFVHNKMVHPASHKFRLIWPRNWWPEGTQDEFLGSEAKAPEAKAEEKGGADQSKAASPEGDGAERREKEKAVRKGSFGFAKELVTADSKKRDGDSEKDKDGEKDAGVSTGYQALRSKVSTWMHNTNKRRGIPHDAPTDERRKGRRPSTSEHMQLLMESARHSPLFVHSRSHSHSHASDPSGEAEQVGRDRDERLQPSDALEGLESLDPAQREMLEDTLAWEMALEGVVEKYRQEQEAGTGAGGGEGVQEEAGGPLDYAQRRAVRNLAGSANRGANYIYPRDDDVPAPLAPLPDFMAEAIAAHSYSRLSTFESSEPGAVGLRRVRSRSFGGNSGNTSCADLLSAGKHRDSAGREAEVDEPKKYERSESFSMETPAVMSQMFQMHVLDSRLGGRSSRSPGMGRSTSTDYGGTAAADLSAKFKELSQKGQGMGDELDGEEEGRAHSMSANSGDASMRTPLEGVRVGGGIGSELLRRRNTMDTEGQGQGQGQGQGGSSAMKAWLRNKFNAAMNPTVVSEGREGEGSLRPS